MDLRVDISLWLIFWICLKCKVWRQHQKMVGLWISQRRWASDSNICYKILFFLTIYNYPRIWVYLSNCRVFHFYSPKWFFRHTRISLPKWWLCINISSGTICSRLCLYNRPIEIYSKIYYYHIPEVLWI